MTLTVGTRHELFPSTLANAHINTDGMAGAVVQKSVWQRMSLAFSVETDFRATSLMPKMNMVLNSSS